MWIVCVGDLVFVFKENGLQNGQEALGKRGQRFVYQIPICGGEMLSECLFADGGMESGGVFFVSAPGSG